MLLQMVFEKLAKAAVLLLQPGDQERRQRYEDPRLTGGELVLQFWTLPR
jgi:hypothetical protein